MFETFKPMQFKITFCLKLTIENSPHVKPLLVLITFSLGQLLKEVNEIVINFIDWDILIIDQIVIKEKTLVIRLNVLMSCLYSKTCANGHL
jgi:hypothetical protein